MRSLLCNAEALFPRMNPPQQTNPAFAGDPGMRGLPPETILDRPAGSRTSILLFPSPPLGCGGLLACVPPVGGTSEDIGLCRDPVMPCRKQPQHKHRILRLRSGWGGTGGANAAFRKNICRRAVGDRVHRNKQNVFRARSGCYSALMLVGSPVACSFI